MRHFIHLQPFPWEEFAATSTKLPRRSEERAPSSRRGRLNTHREGSNVTKRRTTL